MSKFEHFLITAFNVDFNYKPRKEILSPQYLSNRFKIFKQVCYPSVMSQSNQNFKWLVFFDSETPLEFKKEIEQLAQGGKLIPIYTQPQANYTVWRQAIKSYISSLETTHIITSNLDNDDAIGKNFIQVVQDNFAEQDFEFINFPFGYLLRQDGLFLREIFSCPFLSLIENTEDILTCKIIPHQKLGQFSRQGVSVRQVLTAPIWLQLIHDTNVSNFLDINGVIQPLQNLNRDFDVSTIPEDYQKCSYPDSLFSFLLRFILKNKYKIPISRRIRNVLTIIWPLFPLIYWQLIVTIKSQYSQKSKLKAQEAKLACQS